MMVLIARVVLEIQFAEKEIKRLLYGEFIEKLAKLISASTRKRLVM